MSVFDGQVREAIRGRRLLEFSYNGATRVVEPHVYGIRGGEYHLLSFQVGGQSGSGQLPNWRRFNLAKVSVLSVLDDTFAAPRDLSGLRQSDFDEVLEVVR